MSEEKFHAWLKGATGFVAGFAFAGGLASTFLVPLTYMPAWVSRSDTPEHRVVSLFEMDDLAKNLHAAAEELKPLKETVASLQQERDALKARLSKIDRGADIAREQKVPPAPHRALPVERAVISERPYETNASLSLPSVGASVRLDSSSRCRWEVSQEGKAAVMQAIEVDHASARFEVVGGTVTIVRKAKNCFVGDIGCTCSVIIYATPTGQLEATR